MDISALVPLLAGDPQVAKVLDDAPLKGRADIQAPRGLWPGLLAAIQRRTGAPVVVITATSRQGEELEAALRCYLPPQRVALLPAWETLPHERLSPRADTVAQRLTVLRRLAHPEAADSDGPVWVLVVPVRAAMQPIASGLGDLEPVNISIGDQVDIADAARRLEAAAYTRVDMVERRGEFAVRGGILDVFPPTEDHPVRLEFWGDDVEEIRWFSVADQRSLEIADVGLRAPACREILLTAQVRQRAADLVPLMPGAAEMLEKLSEGIAVEGMESLTPLLVDAMLPLTQLLDPASLLVVAEPERVRRRGADLIATAGEFLAAAWHSAAAGADTPLDTAAVAGADRDLALRLESGAFREIDQVRDLALDAGLGWWTVGTFGLDETAEPDAGASPPDASASGMEASSAPAGVSVHRIGASDVESYRGQIPRAVDKVRARIHDGWTVVLTAEGSGSARRLAESLGEAGIGAKVHPALPADSAGEPASGLLSAGVVHVTTGVGRGFLLPGVKLALVAESDITGRPAASTSDVRKMPSRRRNVVDPLQLKAGDYVVHEHHGVGRFVELVQRTVGTGATQTTREYLVLEYAASKKGQPADRLFVPTDSLDLVTKYVGGEAPALNRMGGSDWAKTKGKARKAVKEIAAELIRLYSARMASPGHAFGPDTPWQRELEDAFPYAETPDQLATIDEVKADMEKPIPMDRLICGDVGYGKTEIAVRAAFKAVQDGKQVAVLVPTTLLVQQHLETFAGRYAPYPVVVKPLSRFQTDAEAKATIEGLADGTVDVVIGTHRLLTGQVRFKRLGLVVVDEEQRFGVEHKETLKALRTDVDVLSMSATPIPRTLEMAVSGIREMSTLATPPEDRHPILTYVGPYDNRQVAAAIRRELLREGQVFFIHNRVESIDKAAAKLAELVPEARIAVAHGKMNEHQLERVIVDFWQHNFDVLVCTTIVETGLDISNANTLILERADRFGLSQLHQLRGRVGRGRERAYAYFLYPPEVPLTETAHDRLSTIAANTDLGAGMAVAMKDLEIRGAGNLLGGEQSGHIAGVGFDLYIRMVSEAVAAYRGEQEAEPQEVKIELAVDAHIPHSYIDSERLRLEAYTKLANVTSLDQLPLVREELADRYGPLPEPVEILFEVAQLRLAGRAAGLTDITAQGKFIRFAPVELRDSQALRLRRLYPGSIVKPAIRQILVPAPTTARLGGEPLRDRDVIAWVRQVIAQVLEFTAAPVA